MGRRSVAAVLGVGVLLTCLACGSETEGARDPSDEDRVPLTDTVLEAEDLPDGWELLGPTDDPEGALGDGDSTGFCERDTSNPFEAATEVLGVRLQPDGGFVAGQVSAQFESADDAGATIDAMRSGARRCDGSTEDGEGGAEPTTVEVTELDLPAVGDDRFGIDVTYGGGRLSLSLTFLVVASGSRASMVFVMDGLGHVDQDDIVSAFTVAAGKLRAQPGRDRRSTVPSTRAVPADGASVVDLLDDDVARDYDRSERALLRLVTAPRSFDDGLRAAVVQVDDPNGNGRVDDRWYPPRVVVGDCQIKTDQPPMPMAAASFIPGDPDAAPLGQVAASEALLDAPFSIGVTVQLFDTAEQRDGMAATMEEFYETIQGDLDCGLDSLFGDVEPVEPVDIGEPAIGYRTEPLLGTSTTFLYSVGDRVLLTVGLNLGPKAEDDPAKGPSDDLLERAVRAEASLLAQATLPGG